MAIDLKTLEAAAGRGTYAHRTRTLTEATRAKERTAFLSHSHLDKERALGLQMLLREAGWEVFIDWQHLTLDGERPSKDLPAELQLRIEMCDWLIYLATPNSDKSRWCPWEIGYADKAKGSDAVLVVPTSDGWTTYGSEYLELYRRIDLSRATLRLALFERGGAQVSRDLKAMPASPGAL